jgi:hypothetical protein
VSGCWIVLTREGRTRGLRQGDVATDDR